MAIKTIVVGHKNPDTDSVLSAILVSKFSKKILGFEAESRIAGDVNNETKYILDLVKEAKPKLIKKITNENVVLVDTTEPGQIIEGLTEDNLVGIIDHHNLGGLKSSGAIYVRTESIGCACSLIYKILKEKGVKVDKKSAIMMIAGIVSDTLNLTSPTTTPEDKKFLKELTQLTKVDIKKFVAGLFEAKSSLKGISLDRVVECDYKEFEMGGKKVGIGVWETTNPESVNMSAEKIMKLLEDKKIKEDLDYLLFGVVDILKNNTYCYVIGEAEEKLISDVLGVTTKDKVAFLKGVVSRKKQIVPQLRNHFVR
ncbi:MAG: manganese-dependent inorganic pyrophosphatase [Candidatus Pacebacteria bacterium]|nr:manganese-dependent inorganic pyrophosphatase [Candidatus Paceibacterota bacterium]